MIRVRQIEIPLLEDRIENIIEKTKNILNVKKIESISIHKKSLDARKKPNLFYIYEVDVNIKNEDNYLKYVTNKNILKVVDLKFEFKVKGTTKLNDRPIIVGSGPAGLFASYILAENGFNPIVIERGEDIDNRLVTVNEFWENNILNTESNVQFGEGGAGTFSDGKLTTQVKDPFLRKEKVLDILVDCGANPEIKILNKPHIGTDKLREIVKNIRNKAINNGATYLYNTCLTDIIIKDNKVEAIEVNNKEILKTRVLILAIGHSARDTFKLLLDKKIEMNAKPFAVGVRVEHPQEMININQYGLSNHPLIGASSYKLTYQAHNNRGVYSFCMCPGGYVVNASSEKNKLAINGMSNHSRDSLNANAAIIVTISPKDFGNNPLDGIKFQRMLEEKAYKLGDGQIPIQLYKDFKNNIESKNIGKIEPVFKGNYKLTNLNLLFPDYINEALKEAIEAFGKQIKGYNQDDTILAGVESRTSSPVRITRNEEGESNIKGIYPCGEGAGYAGGITSSAMDGLKIANDIANQYYY
ncbi:MAG: NAD(P)/FAD-dependent oxidoreductase [Bacilli bacterium]